MNMIKYIFSFKISMTKTFKVNVGESESLNSPLHLIAEANQSNLSGIHRFIFNRQL